MTSNGAGGHFSWFPARDAFQSHVEAIRPYWKAAQSWVAQQRTLPGYCTHCQSLTRYTVHGGVLFAQQPNLREGLLCEACRLSSRNRLVFQALVETCEARPNPRVAVLERLSALHEAIARRIPGVIGSEFVSPQAVPGSTHVVSGQPVRHESITGLSYADQSLDVVVHNDVLEHVFQYQRGLAECRRVLKPGGALVFTCPFFMARSDVLTRATQAEDGTVTHHHPPEYHGDPLRPEGVLAFYHYGWGLFEELKNVGFSEAAIGLIHDPFLGFTANNHPDDDYVMLPVMFRALR